VEGRDPSPLCVLPTITKKPPPPEVPVKKDWYNPYGWDVSGVVFVCFLSEPPFSFRYNDIVNGTLTHGES
jgi:hypothetical protein